MAVKKPSITETQKQKSVKRDYVYAVGRKKEAVARVRLYTQVKDDKKWGENGVSKDQILVNEMPIEKYFSGAFAKANYETPLKVTNTLHKYALTIKVTGGGQSGQLAAVVHGISRALALFDKEKYRPLLKTKGLLTRDARVRERRKAGTGGKARRKKQSPKR